MKRTGLAMPIAQLGELLKAHQTDKHIPADAELIDWDRDIVAGEFLFVFQSPDSEQVEPLDFPRIEFE